MIEFAAVTACIILAGLSVFQRCLIGCAPIGRFAWGGQHTVLPDSLRAASVSSIVLYVLFSMVILAKAGLVSLPVDGQIIKVAMWVLTAYFFVGIFMNAISRSKPERFVMTPVAGALAILFLIVALR
jgi:hypothetical protein